MKTSSHFSRRRFLALSALTGVLAVGLDTLRTVAAFAAEDRKSVV